MSNTTELKSFHYYENNEIGFSSLDTVKSTKTLEAGVYDISYLEHPDNRVLVELNTNIEKPKEHNYPDRDKIELLLKTFFNKDVKKEISSLGFYHKVGILLYGDEGTGKSTIIKKLYSEYIESNNVLVFHINSQNYKIKDCWEFISKVRAIQDNPIVIVFEEMDVLIKQDLESRLKMMLDGNLSIDNCIVFGTTNYISMIPDAIKNRPSRFKYCIKIEGIQSEDDVYKILYAMINKLHSENEIIEFSKELKGKTLDTIKQFAIDKIMNIDSYNISKDKKLGF